MEQSNCKFSWSNYIDHVHYKLHDMMKESDLTDVTIVSDDKKHFNAHKVVLKACSSVFQNIIEDLPQSNSVIYLRGIQYQEIESILEYMYLGEVTISQQRVYEFLKVAADLEVKNFDKENINSDSTEPVSDINEMGALNPKAKHNDDTKLETECVESDMKEDQLKIDMDVSNNSNEKYHEVNDMKMAYRSNQKFIMNRHKKEYACNQCELKFSNQSNLTRHIKSQHEEKVSCDQCEKQFKRKDCLKEHYQAAHDKKEFVCKICDYATGYRKILKKHMKIRHNMSIFINPGN